MALNSPWGTGTGAGDIVLTPLQALNLTSSNITVTAQYSARPINPANTVL
jgi:hypothetical protein